MGSYISEMIRNMTWYSEQSICFHTREFTHAQYVFIREQEYKRTHIQPFLSISVGFHKLPVLDSKINNNPLMDAAVKWKLKEDLIKSNRI